MDNIIIEHSFHEQCHKVQATAYNIIINSDCVDNYRVITSPLLKKITLIDRCSVLRTRICLVLAGRFCNGWQNDNGKT